MADIDLECIFIRREDQFSSIDKAVQSWKRQVTSPAKLGSTEQPFCIIWLSGDGGLGKSTFLRHYHEELSTSELSLDVGKIIDWSLLLNNTSRLRYFMMNDVDEMTYLEMMYRQLSWGIDRRLHDFKEYKRCIGIIQGIEREIDRIVGNIQKRVECSALWKIPKVRLLKLLQWFDQSGFYEQDAREATRKLREYAGAGIHIELACMHCLYEELHQKLGEEFNDYLQAGYMLSAALGYDLQRFALDDKPLLIFFDTYECIEKGNYLLTNIIEAAGMYVGWLIAGRSQIEANKNTADFSDRRKYRRSIVSSHAITSFSFQARGAGSFSSEEIVHYFAQVHEQEPTIAPITQQEAERIWTITQGIPLAVRIAAQFYIHTSGLDALLEEGNDTREVVEGMVERYLLYVPYDRRERALLYGLAMLRRTNDLWIIGQLAGMDTSRGGPLEEQLRQLLHTTYAVVIERGQVSLHQEIRLFLRQWLLERQAEPDKQEVARQLQTLLQMRMNDMEKRCPYQRLDQRFDDDDWVYAYLDLIEAQFWVETDQGFSHCLPFILASFIYRRSLLDDVLAIGKFFRGSMTPFHSKRWDWIMQGLRHDPSHDITDIEQSLEKLAQVLANMEQKFPLPFIQWWKELEGALYWRRAVLYQERDRDKAIYWYQKAISHIRQNDALREEAAYLYWLVAQDFYESGAYEKSLDQLRKALKIKFDFADANFSSGNVYSTIGEYERAVIEYQYAIGLDDHHISAYINLGNAYLELKRYQDAIKIYSDALVLEADSVVLHNNRALAYTSSGAYAEALADYHQVIALQPDFAEAYTSRGTIFAYLRRYEEALADYNKAYELCPHDMNIAWMKMWANLGDQHTLEREKVEALIKLAPENYLAHVCRSISLALQRCKLSVILDELEQAIHKEPDQWDHYFWKGMICCYYHKTAMAQDAFDKALAADLPPLLLKPLYWLKPIVPQFFETFAAPLLAQTGL